MCKSIERSADTTKSFPTQSGLYKEIQLHQGRRHSDGNLKEFQGFDCTYPVPLTNSRGVSQVSLSQAFNSPPHYSVIHLSHMPGFPLSNSYISSPAEEQSYNTKINAQTSAFHAKLKNVSTRKNYSNKSSEIGFYQIKPLQNLPSSRRIYETIARKENKSIKNRHECGGKFKNLKNQNKEKNRRSSMEFDSTAYIKFAKRIDSIEQGIAIAYFCQCVLRLCLEVAFLLLQYKLFKLDVPELYQCRRDPCPNTVNCYISRPEEKTLMLKFMFYLTGSCILLAICEVISLIVRHCKEYYDRHNFGTVVDGSNKDIKNKDQQRDLKTTCKKYNLMKHPYLLEGYNKMLRGQSVEDYEETLTSETKSTKSSKSESETEEIQANTFNSQDADSMFENDMAAEMNDINNEENEMAEVFV